MPSSHALAEYQKRELNVRTMYQVKYLIDNYHLLPPNFWESKVPLSTLKAYYFRRRIMEQTK